jgi:hypothetical protein
MRGTCGEANVHHNQKTRRRRPTDGEGGLLLSYFAFFHFGLLLHLYLLFDFLFHFRQVPRLFFI